jgi:hypothetical protein
MKTGLTAALIVLFALGAPCVVIAADEGEQAGSTTESTNTNTEEEKGDTSDTKDQGSADDRGDTETGSDKDAKSDGMSVNRHRAGACPEGPPCPTD